jgi:probable selenium-dependent hydroxylase accessory protein YqeC
VAVFGAGGKSGLLQRLGSELTDKHRNVLLTSLTHSEKFKDWTTLLASRMERDELLSRAQEETYPQVLNAVVKPGKYSGVSTDLLQLIRKQVDICLFESDGARGRSLKAHNDKDPTVPAFSSQVIVVIGADVVNTTVGDGMVHRPQLFCQLWSLQQSSKLNVDMITRVVTSKKGYGHKIPGTVPRVYFVNKADLHPDDAEQLARMIHRHSGLPAYMGSVKANWCVRVN